jgi:hypothetical protein
MHSSKKEVKSSGKEVKEDEVVKQGRVRSNGEEVLGTLSEESLKQLMFLHDQTHMQTQSMTKEVSNAATLTNQDEEILESEYQYSAGHQYYGA